MYGTLIFEIISLYLQKKHKTMSKNIREMINNESYINNNTISPKLLDLIKDIADDGDFVYDLKLKGNSDIILNQILSDKKLLRIALNSIKMDYEHDIKMEKDSGEDVEYLMPIYNEVSGLLKI